MIKRGLLLLVLLIFIVGCEEPAEQAIEVEPEVVQEPVEEIKMQLSSPVFEDNGLIPSKYTCDGEEISPPLEIKGVPAEAVSLVLIMDDPDAVEVGGKVWDHWVIYNMPTTLTEIKEGEEPEGLVGKNGRGKLGYAGPCPPDKEHRYFFKLYALDIKIDLPEGRAKQDVLAEMEGHVVEKVEIIGRYNLI